MLCGCLERNLVRFVVGCRGSGGTNAGDSFSQLDANLRAREGADREGDYPVGFSSLHGTAVPHKD